ncbi:unnamed protein product [Calypogeia fissa]
MRFLPNVWSVVVCILALGYSVQAVWPDGPFSSSGRWIVNTKGEAVTYAGVNWPGAADTMVPEGLQYQSIASIVSKIKELGMNVIRLTYATEMIDDILDNGGDVTVKESMIMALGAANGRKVFDQIVANNPQVDVNTTRLQVFDGIAAECYLQQIYVHLDNHVSKAGWCCGSTDGNGWFGDLYFDVAKWRRGLAYMALQGANWGNMMSMGMRNELRNSGSPTYGWPTWYTNMVAGAKAIYSVNPNTLIFFSGLNFDLDLSPIPHADPLSYDGLAFHNTDFEFQHRTVLELHVYEWVYYTPICTSLESSLGHAGVDSMLEDAINQLPVVISEWGHYQDGNGYGSMYSSCLRVYLPQIRAGWTVWVLAGSYYIRSGTQDLDETWGLLNHDWSDWRYADGIYNKIMPMVQASLSEVSELPHKTGRKKRLTNSTIRNKL